MNKKLYNSTKKIHLQNIQKTQQDLYLGRTHVRELVLKLTNWPERYLEVINQEFKSIHGVIEIVFDDESLKLYVHYNQRIISIKEIKKQLKNIGFKWSRSADKPAKGIEIGISKLGCFLLTLILILIIRLLWLWSS